MIVSSDTMFCFIRYNTLFHPIQFFQFLKLCKAETKVFYFFLLLYLCIQFFCVGLCQQIQKQTFFLT